MPANGRSEINKNASFQLRKQDVRLQTLSPRTEQSFHERIFDKVIKSDQCAQYVDDIGIAANSVTQLIHNIREVFMHQASRTQTIYRQMPLRSNQSRIPRKNDHPTTNRPPRPPNPEFLSKRTIPEIKEASAKIHRLYQLLPQLYAEVVRNITWILRTTESRQKRSKKQRNG